MARNVKIETSAGAAYPRTPRVRAIARTRGVQAVKEIANAMPFCYRHRLDDPALRESIKQYGILVPLLVSQDRRPVVISGYRRLYAAQELKLKEVPVLVVGEGSSRLRRMGEIVPLDSRNAFLLNLVSNWKQTCSEVDRARALDLAVKKFRFEEKDILRVVMPLLGLAEDKAMLELYRRLDLCASSFKDLLEEGRMPFRGVTPFLKFSKKDQDYFSRKIGARVKLTSSQLSQTGEWLADIMKGSGKSLEAVCREHGTLRGMDSSKTDPRTKADRFFSRVKKLRFPGYFRYLDIFEESRAKILRDAKEFRMEPVQGFEEPGFELHARVKSPKDIERLLQKLTQDRPALNSLFEIAL